MKKLVNVANLAFGIILGITISFSPQIYGASITLLGKDVDKQMEVKLNDKVIGQAGVIEGTSYIPVRAFANEYNLDVEVNSTTITLTSPSAEENAKLAQDMQAKADEQQRGIDLKATTDKINRDIVSSQRKIDSYIKYIEAAEIDITRKKTMLDTVNENPQSPAEYKKEAENKYNVALQAKEALQKKLTDETKILADLKAQLAALQ